MTEPTGRGAARTQERRRGAPVNGERGGGRGPGAERENAVSAWQDLVTASLIGTERSAVPPAAIPGVPTSDPASPAGDPAAVLLDRAALLTAARRAGRRPGQAEPLPMCEPDPRPLVSRGAGRRLARMLGGEHPDLLAEWLATDKGSGAEMLTVLNTFDYGELWTAVVLVTLVSVIAYSIVSVIEAGVLARFAPSALGRKN